MGDLYEEGTKVSEVSQRRFDTVLDRPMVFLLSPPRSGSTLLCAMLARHPKLYGALELSLLPFDSMGARGRQFDLDGHPWKRLGLFSAIKDLTGMTSEQATQKYARLEERAIAVSTVYARLQELAEDRILVDKSPIYVLRPDSLVNAERLFRSPRYIHPTRHPGAVIESFVRMRFHRLFERGGPGWDENPWILGEKVWTSANLHVLRFLQGVDPNRQLRDSYESLVADPAAVITGICHFLGIPFDAGPLQPYAGLDASLGGTEDLRAGDPGFFTHSEIEAELASEWRRTLPPHPFGRITQEVAAALGYSVQ
ncbi:MAG TPA: sulfotransferase [Stellaceae bacterium]|nr:sulfotransferase [Stellaceae bacterium]